MMNWFKNKKHDRTINPFGIAKDEFEGYGLARNEREHEINEAVFEDGKERRSSEYISKTVKNVLYVSF